MYYHNLSLKLKKGLSRGRGIKCFNNLNEIINYIYGKKSQFVCQKYIENPLILNKKKVILLENIKLTINLNSSISGNGYL